MKSYRSLKKEYDELQEMYMELFSKEAELTYDLSKLREEEEQLRTQDLEIRALHENVRKLESGLGISILPQLILKRVPYHIVVKELDVPAYRNIGLAVRNKKTISLAVEKFMEYLQYR